MKSAISSNVRHPERSEGPLYWLLLLLVPVLLAIPAHPQGCSQCRESIGQTPIRTQIAYRRAITLMVIASGSVFTAGVVLLRRFR
jgi:hypothetical protein